MDMNMSIPSIVSSVVMASSTPVPSMSMAMGGDGTCKLSMLLNWTTIDSCFLFSSFHIRTNFVFILTCLGSFLLVISLEGLRRFQREFDAHLKARSQFVEDIGYTSPEGLEEKLLDHERDDQLPDERSKRSTMGIIIQQILRGLIQGAQFSISYCIMLLFMYSNGYVIMSIIIGAVVGFALFTRDTLRSKYRSDTVEREKACC